MNKKKNLFKKIGKIAEVVLYLSNFLVGLYGIISLYVDWRWNKK